MGKKADVAVARAKTRAVGIMVAGWEGSGDILVAGWEVLGDIGDNLSSALPHAGRGELTKKI